MGGRTVSGPLAEPAAPANVMAGAREDIRAVTTALCTSLWTRVISDVASSTEATAAE